VTVHVYCTIAHSLIGHDPEIHSIYSVLLTIHTLLPPAHLSSIDLFLQKPRRRPCSFIQIRVVRRGNGQRTRTNKVAHSTIHFQVIRREVRNTTAVLRVLGVAEEHDALDLVADGLGELGDCAGDYGGALALGVLAW
jgi:hypothetical protein